MGATLFKWLFIVFSVMVVLFVISNMFSSEGWSKEAESKTPFECGVDPCQVVKMPFLMHFFYVTIIFLIFDVELAMILPLISSSLSDLQWSVFWFIFFFLLFLGLAVEEMLETLSWKE